MPKRKISDEIKKEDEITAPCETSTLKSVSIETLSQIKEAVRDKLVRGNVSNENIAVNIRESGYGYDGDNGDENDLLTNEYLFPVIDQVRNDMIEEQSKWTHVTHNDMLDLAEKQLELNHDIIFVQDIGTTPSSCWYEVDEVIGKMNGEEKFTGAAFYHFQSTDRAIEGGLLYINYGATDYGKKLKVSSQTVKLTSMSVFSALGLPLASGNTIDSGKAIELRPFKWEKRLVMG